MTSTSVTGRLENRKRNSDMSEKKYRRCKVTDISPPRGTRNLILLGSRVDPPANGRGPWSIVTRDGVRIPVSESDAKRFRKRRRKEYEKAGNNRFS